MEQNKIESYLGFSVKSRKILYGLNLIEGYRKRIYMLIMCDTASENTKKSAINFATAKNLDLYLVKYKKLEELVNKSNCKVVAITDTNLSKAMKATEQVLYKII